MLLYRSGQSALEQFLTPAGLSKSKGGVVHLVMEPFGPDLFVPSLDPQVLAGGTWH